jgi:hypothetical protein
VLEHCREGEIKCLFQIFGAFSSDRIPKETKGVNVHFFHPAAVIVNYTSEFWEPYEVIT